MGQVRGRAPRDQFVRRAPWDRFVVGLRGTSPALAGNVGTGGAFALSRDGDQDVDVPTLAPDRSRCRLVVSNEGRGRSHLFTQKGTLFTSLMSLLGLRGTGHALAAASWRRRKALGR